MARKRLKTNPVPVRLSDVESELIDKAAEVAGENRSEFIRNAAKQRAETLLSEAMGEGNV